MGTGNVLDGHSHLVAGAPLHWSGREPPEPDLGSLQVRKDRYRPACLITRLPDHGVDPRVLSMGAMAEIEASNVHAGPDQVPDFFWGRGGRADRADNLCAAAHAHRLDRRRYVGVSTT